MISLMTPTKLRPGVLAVLIVLLVSLPVNAKPAAAAPESPTVTDVPLNQRLALNGEYIRFASITLGNLDTNPATLEMVVGGKDGRVHAVKMNANGTLSPLWSAPFQTTAEVNSAPAIADVNGDGHNEVVVTVGSNFRLDQPGGMYILDRFGKQLFHMTPGPMHGESIPAPIFSSAAVGDLDGDGKVEIIFGSWDQYLYCYHGDGTPCAWSPRFLRDTIWSSPALGDIDGDGELEIVIGVDTHYEAPFRTIDGGRLYAINADGTDVPGFPQDTDETIMSSPALGDINGDGRLDIVVGSGGYWHQQPGHDPNAGRWVKAYDYTGRLLWTAPCQGIVMASPVLGDVNGDGKLEIIAGDEAGYLHAWKGDGTPLWAAHKLSDRYGNAADLSTSPILADFDGDGQVDILQPMIWDIQVVNARTGVQTHRAMANYTISGSPAVGDINGNGRLELVVGSGTRGGAQAEIALWSLNSSPATAPWPMFRHNRLHTGIVSGLTVRGSTTAFDVPLMMQVDGIRQTGPSTLTVGGAGWQFETIVSQGNDWLTVTPAKGTAPAQLSLSILPHRMAVGVYEGVVTVKGPSNTVPVRVSLRVAPKLYQSYSPLHVR